MNKILKSVMTAVASLALAVGFAVAPANAVPSPSTLYSGGPAGSTTDCSGPIGLYSDSAHTTAVTAITGGGSAAFQNDCTSEAVYLTFGSSISSVSGSLYIAGGIPRNTSSLMFSASGTFSLYLCAPAMNPGSTSECSNSGTRSLELTVPLTVSGGGSNGGGSVTPPSSSSPSISVTPATTAVVTPSVGTAAALAELPKSTTAPKLKFDSSANGIGKSAKKSLKKVATVAKDGYGVRVTGAAGMQPGVSKDVVKKLAKKRALEIRDYLVKQGVNKEDIIIKTKIYPIGKAPATLVKIETLS